MQSVEKNNVSRIKNPLFVASLSLAIGGLMLSEGCRTKGPDQTKVEPPPTAIMPPSPPPANSLNLTPPPAMPVFTPPPPMNTMPESTGGMSYTVKSGDSLSKIAAHHGVSAREIAELNNITNPGKIRVGQKLVLPAYAKEGATAASKKSTGGKKSSKTTAKKSSGGTSAAGKTTAAAGEGEYVVKSGDSLSKIATHLHTSVKALKAANSLQSDKLKIGQKLKVSGASGASAKPAAPDSATPSNTAPVDATPAPAPVPTPSATPAASPGVGSAAPAAPAAPQTFEVDVAAGDTLDSIATKYGVLPTDIKKLNNITEVAPGQKIKLPLPTP